MAETMACPMCGHTVSTVKDSRARVDFTAIRRRRLCEGCGHRFTTFEFAHDGAKIGERGLARLNSVDAALENMTAQIAAARSGIAAAIEEGDK